MRKIVIDDCTLLYVFDELSPYETIVSVLIRKKCYIMDTFLGPKYMKTIMDDLNGQEVVIINSHHHFDHGWGNCYFEGCDIISSKETYTILLNEWDEIIESNKEYYTEDIKKCLPTIVIDESYEVEEGLVILFTPGHTKGDISIYDRKNKYLFVGDMIEKPLIQLDNDDLKRYIESCELYLSLDTNVIVGGHNCFLTKEDVIVTRDYLEKLVYNETVLLDSIVHHNNVLYLERRKNERDNKKSS